MLLASKGHLSRAASLSAAVTTSVDTSSAFSWRVNTCGVVSCSVHRAARLGWVGFKGMTKRTTSRGDHGIGLGFGGNPLNRCEMHAGIR